MATSHQHHLISLSYAEFNTYHFASTHSPHLVPRKWGEISAHVPLPLVSFMICSEKKRNSGQEIFMQQLSIPWHPPSWECKSFKFNKFLNTFLSSKHVWVAIAWLWAQNGKWLKQPTQSLKCFWITVPIVLNISTWQLERGNDDGVLERVYMQISCSQYIGLFLHWTIYPWKYLTITQLYEKS